MISINKRLDLHEQKEYVLKVKKCMDTDQWNKFEQSIQYIYEDMMNYEYGLYNDIQINGIRWKKEVGKDYIIYSWLTLEYSLLERIKNYIDKNYIKPSLNNYNSILRKYDYKELQGYCDLVKRRNYSYSNHKDVSVKLKQFNNYDKIYSEFVNYINIYGEFSKQKINWWIVDKTNVKVCPYCNLAYTYNRKEKVTAQLDHFFSKSEYPMFSLCYYNLIPSCPVCNHIKLDNNKKMSSPYEENAFKDIEITWKLAGGNNSDEKTLKELCNEIEINIKSDKEADINNITIMKIDEAYNYHKDYASEIIKKIQTYLNEDSKKLIQSIAFKNLISDDEIERFYFGTYLDEAKNTDRILSKMVRDFTKQYKLMNTK
ncbi:hypothetical protein [Clostridium beijerinckii]|uniref:hypothetical protein n=1 Tax=Clostridium beijerinckii TaxID=1520 RepID=UPI00080A4D99|nr:hypothetical protein [Clostridium beijerinckii]OCB00109.1 hypothetical protein BGS1_12720 [Clostridium beijerinckii]